MSTLAPPPERLTCAVEEAAALLGISRSFVYEAVKRGEISHLQGGRRASRTKRRVAAALDGSGASRRRSDIAGTGVPLRWSLRLASGHQVARCMTASRRAGTARAGLTVGLHAPHSGVVGQAGVRSVAGAAPWPVGMNRVPRPRAVARTPGAGALSRWSPPRPSPQHGNYANGADGLPGTNMCGVWRFHVRPRLVGVRA